MSKKLLKKIYVSAAAGLLLLMGANFAQASVGFNFTWGSGFSGGHSPAQTNTRMQVHNLNHQLLDASNSESSRQFTVRLQRSNNNTGTWANSGTSFTQISIGTRQWTPNPNPRNLNVATSGMHRMNLEIGAGSGRINAAGQTTRD